MKTAFPQSADTDQSALLTVLAFMRPCRALEQPKIRYGALNDGGYVMLDGLTSAMRALSLGIGHNDEWDMDLAQRGLRVDQYDPTLARPLSWHVNLHFHPVRITPHPADGCATLSYLIAQDDRVVALKIDIEGAEWDVLDTTPRDALARCQQICVEFHGLHRLAERSFRKRAARVFKKLSETHAVVHVHANNHGAVGFVKNIPIPNVLEVSFAALQSYTFVETEELFPGTLDAPNDPGAPDIRLGAFKF